MLPDISEFQGAVDWNALGAAYRAGIIEAVGIRAGFGTVRPDHQFLANQAGARAHGIPAIYYWFNYPTFNTPQAEAAMFNAVVGPLGPREAMAGDFEDDEPASTFPRGQAGVDWAQAFLTAVEAPQNATWWYTYPFLLSVIPFQQFYGVWPFWLADYSATPDSAFTQAAARQFTNCGATPGVAGCCDQSRILKAPLSQWLTGDAPVTSSEKNAFVRLAYNAFLWRVPTTDELALQAGAILDDGTNVDQIMANIEDSSEGQRIQGVKSKLVLAGGSADTTLRSYLRSGPS